MTEDEWMWIFLIFLLTFSGLVVFFFCFRANGDCKKHRWKRIQTSDSGNYVYHECTNWRCDKQMIIDARSTSYIKE